MKQKVYEGGFAAAVRNCRALFKGEMEIIFTGGCVLASGGTWSEYV